MSEYITLGACGICGAHVSDRPVHEAWHLNLQRAIKVACYGADGMNPLNAESL